MKYLTMIVMSLTVFLFAACSSGGEEPTVEPEATETKPALETAVPTEAPDPTDESYPAAEPIIEPVDESYPGAVSTVEAIDPYPDQEAETASVVVIDSAYPAEPSDGQQQELPELGMPDDSTAITQKINQALADRLSVDMSEITVVIIEAVEWSDSSLGCPAPGYVYAQAITPGYQITLKSGGEDYTYHTDLNGNFLLCGEDGQPVE